MYHILSILSIALNPCYEAHLALTFYIITASLIEKMLKTYAFYKKFPN